MPTNTDPQSSSPTSPSWCLYMPLYNSHFFNHHEKRTDHSTLPDSYSYIGLPLFHLHRNIVPILNWNMTFLPNWKQKQRCTCASSNACLPVLHPCTNHDNLHTQILLSPLQHSHSTTHLLHSPSTFPHPAPTKIALPTRRSHIEFLHIRAIHRFGLLPSHITSNLRRWRESNIPMWNWPSSILLGMWEAENFVKTLFCHKTGWMPIITGTHR